MSNKGHRLSSFRRRLFGSPPAEFRLRRVRVHPCEWGVIILSVELARRLLSRERGGFQIPSHFARFVIGALRYSGRGESATKDDLIRIRPATRPPYPQRRLRSLALLAMLRPDAACYLRVLRFLRSLPLSSTPKYNSPHLSRRPCLLLPIANLGLSLRTKDTPHPFKALARGCFAIGVRQHFQGNRFGVPDSLEACPDGVIVDLAGDPKLSITV